MELLKVVRLELNGIGIFHSRYIPFSIGLVRRVYERHNNFPIPNNDGLDIYKDDKEWFVLIRLWNRFNNGLRRKRYSILLV